MTSKLKAVYHRHRNRRPMTRGERPLRRGSTARPKSASTAISRLPVRPGDLDATGVMTGKKLILLTVIINATHRDRSDMQRAWRACELSEARGWREKSADRRGWRMAAANKGAKRQQRRAAAARDIRLKTSLGGNARALSLPACEREKISSPI